jgi:hypothetical protein
VSYYTFMFVRIIIYYDLTLLSIGLYRIVSVKYKRNNNELKLALNCKLWIENNLSMLEGE